MFTTLTEATIATGISAEEYHARERRGESVDPLCGADGVERHHWRTLRCAV